VRADVFAEMAKAHEQLARQLAGKDVTLADAERAIQQFAAKAGALAQIVQQFQKSRRHGTAMTPLQGAPTCQAPRIS